MRAIFPLTAVSAAAALLCACGDPLPNATEVTKFRILGVQADPPEIAPGEQTALRMLTADPKGGGRRVVGGGIVVPGQFTPSSSPDPAGLPPLYYALPFTDASAEGIVSFPDHLAIPEYYLVPNPEFDPDDPESEENLEVPIAPPGEPLVMTAILFVCAGDGFDEGAALAALAALEASGTMESVGPLAFEDLCVDAGADEGVAAVKTFDVVTCDTENSGLSCEGEYEQNANPEIESVWIEGLPLTSHVGGVCLECDPEHGCRDPMKVKGYLTEGSFQRYERLIAANLEGTEIVYERTYISWFTTGGKFDEERSGNGSTIDEVLPDDAYAANWVPPHGGGAHTVWAVAHDVRGGVSREIYHVTAGVPE